ncbi:hypothetical protein V2J09_022949 [Rumex salicifolius]
MLTRSISSFPFSLFLLFLFSSTFFFFSFSQVSLHFHSSVHSHSISGWEGGARRLNYSGDVNAISVGTTTTSTERVLLDDSADLTQTNSSLVLAPKRTRRKDPLDDFKFYTGGWNISDRHYWASVIFTAVPFFGIATAWFLLFGFCLVIICCCRLCCSREPYGYSRLAYALSLIFLILFTIASIIGCVILYTGQSRFHNSTTKTLDYAISQADDTVWKLRNVSDYLSAAKQIGIDGISLPSNVQTDIDEIETKINSSASMLSDKAVDNAGNIQDVLDSVVAADTCVAMDQWALNPTAHTAIDDLLPCVDNATSQETLMRSKEVTSQLVDLVNQVINNVSNINFGPNFKPFYYNQTGPLVPLLCNPYRPDLTDRPCSSGEVDLNNATLTWQGFVCQVSSTGVCTTTGRLTPSFYTQMMAAVNVSYGLVNYSPFLVDLEDCTYARETFRDVYREHCPGLRHYSRWVYAGLVVVSGAVMLSLVFWVIYGRERKHRVYTKHVMEGGAKAY